MSSVAFSLATPDDDAGMRALLSAQPMPGPIRLRLEREPDYFSGCGAMGSFTQTLIAKEGERVVGLACRAVRPVFINGERRNIGYLGQLRVDPCYQGRSLVALGFRRLRELHEDGRARSYVTTIVDGNEQAEGVLVRHRRRGMPRYRLLDRLVTLALSVRRGTHRPPESGEWADVRAFLNRHGPSMNFFSVWDEGATPGLTSADFVVVVRGGEIAGAAGLWDQSAYKQTVVDGYSRALGALRPFLNCAAMLSGRTRLPRAGTALRAAYGAFFCARDQNFAIVRELIERLLTVAAERGHSILLLGFTESDPSLAAARTFRHIAYRSSIYAVSWDDGDDFYDQLDSRPRYLDIAML